MAFLIIYHLTLGPLLVLATDLVTQDLNIAPFSLLETKTTTSTSNNSIPSCICNQTEIDSFLEKANLMKSELVNRTTLLSKIRHRATHSHEAVWASLSLSGLMVLLVLGVLHSKMWRDRSFISYQESQPVKLEQYDRKAEVKVKDLLRSRGRALIGMFGGREAVEEGANTLKMETFLFDTVDSSHKALIESSEEEFLMETESEEEDEVFRINSRTGEWEGTEDEEISMSLLTRKRRTSSTSWSSESSRFSQLHSNLTRDLIRLSDSDLGEGEEKMMVKVG